MSRRLLAGSRGTSGGFTTYSAYNDEFAFDTGGWELLGSDLPDIASTAPGRLWMPPGSAAVRRSIPPLPFTVTAYCTVVTAIPFDLSIPGNVSLGIGESDAWPIEWWGSEFPDIDIPGRTARYDARVTSGGVFTHLGTKIEAVGHVYDVPTYHQIVAHSATDMDLYYSTDNVTYTAYGTGFNPTITPGSIIFVSNLFETEWEWVRFRAGATNGPA